MSKYRHAALLIQRSKSIDRTEISSYRIYHLGYRGHLGRKQFLQVKSIATAYQNEIHQLCNTIEMINDQLVQKLNQLNDKLPGK